MSLMYKEIWNGFCASHTYMRKGFVLFEEKVLLVINNDDFENASCLSFFWKAC
jgi:hypothetical protein